MHAQKPQNINDQISIVEIHLGELHAKLPRSSQDSVPCHDQAQLVWRASEGLEGLAAVPVGGGRAWPGFETARRAEGSRRGRLAGGPPPTGTPSSPAQGAARPRGQPGTASSPAHQVARPSEQPGLTRQRVERSAKAEWSGGACLELTSSWAIRKQGPPYSSKPYGC